MKRIRVFLMAGIMLLLHACNLFAPVDPLTPSVSEVSVIRASTSGATVSGSLQALSFENDRQEKKSGKIVEYGFVYGTSNEPVIEGGTLVKVGEDNPPMPFQFERDITGLTVLTTYFIRVYAKNEGGGVGYGPVATFKTDRYVFADLSIAGKVTNSTKTSADASVSILSLGNALISSFGVCFSSTNKVPTTQDTKAQASGRAAVGNFTVPLTGLSTGTTYYARAYALTLGGNVYSDEVLTFNLGEQPVYTAKKKFIMYYSNPYDLDTGELVSQQGSEDMTWYPYDGKAGIYPKNGAKFAVLGKVNFDDVPYAQIAKAQSTLTADMISGSYTPTKADPNLLPTGTVVIFQTNQGRLGKMLVEAHGEERTPNGGGNMEITILTFDK
ncbi:hypothetical protein [Dyadobacter sp. CY347]|uniref:hypothetical protein n=1 Tax=Dyadobacter sp. CY347 TaxID=2909336 RepID=UPI001F1952E7|nr:hypothetical protein [Dyadobacter sp. CY347]MCF2490488.1 hypothetical protein [Dyadobacter sp. CY347]